MKKNRKAITAMLLTLTLILGSFSTGFASSKQGASDTLIYGIDGDPGNSVNVITTGDRYGLMELKLIYSPLYMYNGSKDIVFFLAESIKPSTDYLSYTVKLRKNVKWHDGKPFTADDVVFTYEQMLKESNGGWARSQLILGNKPVKVQKVDELTVKFILPKVSVSAVEALGNIFIMPKHIYQGEANIENSKKNQTPVGTGPYKLAEYKAGEYVKFEKNDTYFFGTPKISKVVYRIIGDANTAGLALSNGEINALAIPPADVSKYSNNSNISVIPYSEGRIGYLAFNLGSKTVQDKQVRKAILYALNKNELLTGSFLSNKYADPAYTFLPKKATYYSDKVEKYFQNVSKSKTLLAKAKIGTLKLRLAYTANNKIYQTQAAIIQQQLKAAGIELQLVGMDSTALSEKLEKKQSDFELYLSGYIMGIDPDTFNSLFVTGSPSNYMHYSNKTVDRLFDEGRIEKDSLKRKLIYQKIQQTIIDDVVIYPIIENKRILAISSNVSGIKQAGLVPIYTFEDMSKLFFK